MQLRKMQTKKVTGKKTKVIIKHDDDNNEEVDTNQGHENFQIAFIKDSEPAESKLKKIDSGIYEKPN